MSTTSSHNTPKHPSKSGLTLCRKAMGTTGCFGEMAFHGSSSTFQSDCLQLTRVTCGNSRPAAFSKLAEQEHRNKAKPAVSVTSFQLVGKIVSTTWKSLSGAWPVSASCRDTKGRPVKVVDHDVVVELFCASRLYALLRRTAA